MTKELYTTSFPGIGRITQLELTAKTEITSSALLKTDYYDFNIFATPAKPKILTKLRTIEDIFIKIDQISLRGTREDLKMIKNNIIQFNLFPSLQLHRQFNSQPGRRVTWRIIAQSTNPRWQKYRRKDLQKAVELGIEHQFPKWKKVDDRAHLEFWIQVVGQTALIGLRLTDKTIRHRQYKTANQPGSLRPTIAAALAFISRPQFDETIFDPFCGVGTILIERAIAGPHRLLIGSDTSDMALKAAQHNFGHQHKPWKLHHWDATQLPLPNHSIDKIITNPPWNIKIKSTADLVPKFISESWRVLRPKGQLILITSQPEIFLKKIKALYQLKQSFSNILVLGQPATILILQKLSLLK